jgi:hypothetical protein
MSKVPKLPDIPEEERSPFVVELLDVIHYQIELIQALRDEVAVLKGNNPKPKIRPGKMEKESEDNQDKKSSDGKRPGSKKKNKTGQLEIHETISIAAENIPKGSKFKGYKDFIVQGLIIKAHNICYRMHRWEKPGGGYVDGKLPPTVRGHFNLELISYILYQYYQCHVTQPLLLEQLHELDIDISSGQVNRILVEGHDSFHTEKNDILRVGLDISSYVNVDDTGARHRGKNGVCTHIGNELFAWFKSTDSKSRINFLELLRAENKDYQVSPEALDYMKAQKLPKSHLQILKEDEVKVFSNKEQWDNHLRKLGINQKRHIKIITEGALLGSVLEHGFNCDMVILSDDAGQFNILLHALCWIHAERTISKIVPFTEEQRTALKAVRERIWNFYYELKLYKKNPTLDKKIELENKFNEIFQEKTCFITLNQALKRLHNNKSELLLVLDRSEIPLHNNLSETDIREYVKRRKISGSTRSDLGRKCRDTFTSLKKTCRKLDVSFWDYLNDRIDRSNTIPQLGQLMRQRAPT